MFELGKHFFEKIYVNSDGRNGNRNRNKEVVVAVEEEEELFNLPLGSNKLEHVLCIPEL